MVQTGVMKVRLADGSWKEVGFPNPGGGRFKAHDGDMWHYADNYATVRTGRLKVNIGGGEWQHVSWMRGPHVPLDHLTVRASARWDSGIPASVGSFDIPMPAAVQVDDLLVLAAYPGDIVVTDPRLTDYGNGAYAGRATDLSPVTFDHTTSGSFNVVQLVVFVNPEGSIVNTGTTFIDTLAGDSDPFPPPVVPGVKAAVACGCGAFRTVTGWVQPVSGGVWSGTFGTSGFRTGAISYWDDPAATGTPAVPMFEGNGGPGKRWLTVLGLY